MTQNDPEAEKLMENFFVAMHLFYKNLIRIQAECMKFVCVWYMSESITMIR